MSRFWSNHVHELEPYVPGEQPRHDRLVKLNTNENPYAPSPRALDAIRSAADDGLRLYPDPESRELRQTLARHFDLTPSQIFVGNGSDEVLAHIFLALLQQDKPLLFPDISYSFYPVYCNLYGINFEPVPLSGDFSINVADYARDSGAVILPNPNAPTGLLLSLSDIRALLLQNPDRLVVVDEAYIDFGGLTATTLVDQYDNLLVVQTLSKSRALAGLRVGFAFGQPDLIDALNRVKNSFNSYPLDRLAQAGAIAAIEDNDHFQTCCKKIIADRDRLTTSLEARGFNVLPSAANFVFVRPPGGKAAEAARKLREDGVIVRHFSKPDRINEWLRISVGTQAQHQRLLDAIDAT
jgi:histidinol-phosphate aminotransferase